MRKERDRSRGAGRNVVLAAAALGALVAAGFWPRAEATPTRAQHLDAVLRSPAGEYRQCQAIEELRKIDSTGARDALKDLADSTDDRTAALAIRALARANFSGARTKIEGIYEDTSRSDLVRGVALAVWCTNRADAGKSWSDVKQWVKSKAGSNQVLRSQYAASKAMYWASEVDSE